MVKISALVTTLNDEEKLEGCLESLNWVNEIVVIDLSSSDKTPQIAAKLGAKVFSHPYVEYVEKIRNWSLEKTSGDWILLLDPDEKLPATLKEELLRIKKEDIVGVLIPRKNFIFGKWISHSAWWPDYKLRFFKRGKVTWSGKIHIDAKPEGKILKLPAKEKFAIIHYAYSDLSSFLTRMNRYTTVEAEEKVAAKEKFGFLKMIADMGREFTKRFLKGEGFLDGLHGFVLAILMVLYRFMVWVKLWEAKRR
ncbi:MAG: glycosyltransferase family 2 protein [bacterium]|nr:glycosyltransferase family 2 protein [bacterium]